MQFSKEDRRLVKLEARAIKFFNRKQKDKIFKYLKNLMNNPL